MAQNVWYARRSSELASVFNGLATVEHLLDQALRYLGQRHVDDNVISVLRRRLGDADKAHLLKDWKYAPAWIAAILRRVAIPGD